VFIEQTLAAAPWTFLHGPLFSIHIGARDACTAFIALDFPIYAGIPLAGQRLWQKLVVSSGLAACLAVHVEPEFVLNAREALADR